MVCSFAQFEFANGSRNYFLCFRTFFFAACLIVILAVFLIRKYGAVQDVRIPCQQRRMFGFVTFVSAKTVEDIFNKGNPHFVRGARVLVKPYREKSKPIDRLTFSLCEEGNLVYPVFFSCQFHWILYLVLVICVTRNI